MQNNSKCPSLFDLVALLTDIPARQLTRGQVGTVIELLDADTLLVEFSDDQGSASAIASCTPNDLLVLHHALEAA
jgi:Domain of unknown function (DUF4926)